MNSQRSDRIIRKSRKPFKRRDSSQRSNLGNSLSASPKVTKRNRTHAVSSRNVHRVMHCLEKVSSYCLQSDGFTVLDVTIGLFKLFSIT